jgi:Kef-type K+ transport system membrane component KefB
VSSPHFVQLLLQLAALLGVAILFGQALRALRQPSVMGELLGGVVLGPTLLGQLFPGVAAGLFGGSPEVGLVRETLTRLGMLFFLFVAGLETDLSELKRSGRAAVRIGLCGTLLPLAMGVALVRALPASFWGPQAEAQPFVFAVFVGLNLANSAIPVLARILMELGLLETRVGTTCMAAAVVDDLVTWGCFAVILARLSPSGPAATGAPVTLGVSLLLLLAVVGFGRRLGPRGLRWVKGHVSWPAGFIAVTAVLILAAAGASEALGTHAFLGAFLLGVGLGGDDAEHQEAQGAITRFALGFFAPLYFVSLGLTTDFARHFDAALVSVVLAAAMAGKLAGVLLGARLAGLRLDRETWAIGFGLNARGATGIILAAVGRQAGVIDDRVFVALAVMAFLTSLAAGPAMSRLLRGRVSAGAGAGPAPTSFTS